MSVPAPQYTLIEGLATCLALARRALDEVRALARIPGPEGQRGPKGDAGEKGDRGEPGKPGATGAAGLDGKDGARGSTGEPGRNASDLTLLQEHIDERIAQVFKAAKITTADGGRTLLVSLAGTIHEVKTSIPIHVGLWKENTTYVVGDGVTHGGQFFIAKRDTTATPLTSEDWQLVVQRGAKGRDWRPEQDKRAAEPVRFK
jgi:Collagen triple helix repeat (20 copies)